MWQWFSFPKAQWSLWETDRFKLFLDTGINTVHEFSCTDNVVCVHVTFTVVTVHAVCEGLAWNQEDPVPYQSSAQASFGKRTSPKFSIALGPSNYHVNYCLLNLHPFCLMQKILLLHSFLTFPRLDHPTPKKGYPKFGGHPTHN